MTRPTFKKGDHVAHVRTRVRGVVVSDANVRMSNGGHPMYRVRWAHAFAHDSGSWVAHRDIVPNIEIPVDT